MTYYITHYEGVGYCVLLDTYEGRTTVFVGTIEECNEYCIRHNTAVEVYESIKDMDHMDYSETYNEDVEYIADLLKTRTRDEVIDLLTD